MVQTADKVRNKGKEVGIELSSYSMPANFRRETDEKFDDEEMERIKEHGEFVRILVYSGSVFPKLQSKNA